MKLLVVISIYYVAIGCNAKHLRLTNNEVAEPGEFPFLVSLIFDGAHICGGSLISIRHAVTAAHCVYKYHQNDIGGDRLKITVGATSSPGGTIMELDRIRYHKDYVHSDTQPTFYADIAVMRTKLPVPLSKYVDFIDLPPPFWEVPAGRKLVVTGFGANVLNGPPSPILKKLAVYSIEENACKHWWSSTPIPNSLFCTNYAPAFGVCQGDSGGPVIMNDKYLIGIVSAVHSTGCGTGYPDLITKVSHFINFINSEMEADTPMEID